MNKQTVNEEVLCQLPSHQPILRVVPRPNDANPHGDIFGGWVMSQIDTAAATCAMQRARGPVVTIAVKELHFIKPIFVYDLVSIYTAVTAVGKTSITVTVDVYAQRERGSYDNSAIKVSEATLVFVAVSEPGKPRAVPVENSSSA